MSKQDKNMRLISIQSTYIKNFRSFKNEYVTFTNSNGLILLTGKNDQEPRLGANGAGKSSLFESVVWCLFGSGTKGAKTSSILAWNQTQVEVLTEIVISNVLHSIYRC